MLINGVEYKIGPHAFLYRANLSGANLSGANLSGANLRSADLRSADLSWANLRSADLRSADLRSADLRSADLRSADLSGANLSGANLRSADLRSADLSWADIEGADFSGTCLDPKQVLPRISFAELRLNGLEPKGNRVYGWRTRVTQHYGDTDYSKPGVYESPLLDSYAGKTCSHGIYFASKGWLLGFYDDSAGDFVRCYALQGEIVHAGDKFRARRIFVTTERRANAFLAGERLR